MMVILWSRGVRWSVREVSNSQPQLLALAVEGAGVDSQDAGRVFAAGAALEQEPDVLGFEPFQADRQADLDRSGEPAACSRHGRGDLARQVVQADKWL